MARIIQPLVSSLEKNCSRWSLLARIYAYPYRQVVQREAGLAGITARDRVLNVGCGAVPFTAIHLAELTGAAIRAVDRDPGAVERARHCLRKLGLGSRVEVAWEDSARGYPGDFSVALVALQAEPKELIFQNLFARSLPGTRLVFRRPSPGFAGHYDHLPGHWKPRGQVRQGMKTFDCSQLFIKG